MSKMVKDVFFYALFGLVIGALIGFFLAGAYVNWRFGLSIETMGLMDALRVSPWGDRPVALYWNHVLYLTGGAAIVCGIGMIALGVRPELSSHGSAKWATLTNLAQNGLLSKAVEVPGPIYAKTSLPKGRGKYITSRDIPHSFIAAPTGSGKGVGVVIPTLLTYPGSVICLDVKGENFSATARRRASEGDRIYKFAPFDKHERTHRFNPLEDVAKLPAKRRYSEAQRIAESLIVLPGDGAQGFLPTAKQILSATILVAVERGVPTFAAVHDILSQGGDPNGEAEGGFADLFKKLMGETEVEEAKAVFTRMSAIDYRTLSAYMSVLFDGGLGQWRDPYVRAATETSDFSISDLRRIPASIYIVVGPNDLKVLSPLIRLMFQQTVSILQRSEPGEDEPYPVLLLMDEFASLGKMDSLSQGITTLRSYGGRMMIVAQSISNLKQIYGNDGAQNFLANCRLQLFMAPADAETPDYISRAIGDFTRKSRSKSWQSNSFTGGNIQEREEGARLIRSEELRSLSDDEVVLLIQGQDPVRANKVCYYEDRELKPLFEGQTANLPQPPTIEPMTGTKSEALNSVVEKSKAIEKETRTGEGHQRDTSASSPGPKVFRRATKGAELTKDEGDSIDSDLNDLLLAIDTVAVRNMENV